MNADKIIRLVLDEGRGRPVVDDDRKGKDPNFSRRESRFVRSIFNKGILATRKGDPLLVHPTTTFKQAFGEGFKNDDTHFRNTHLMPMLAHSVVHAHATLKSSPDHPDRERLETIKRESSIELMKHLSDLVNEVHSHCRKRHARLDHGPVIKDPGAYLSGDLDQFPLTHDTLDHGTVGALPSVFGEHVAGHNALVRIAHHEHRKKNSLNSPEYDLAMENARKKTLAGLVDFYSSIATKRINAGSPSPIDYHDALISTSRNKKSWKQALGSFNRNDWSTPRGRRGRTAAFRTRPPGRSQ